MNILFVCQHYWPEPFNSTDVCETLVQKGHSVTVLTGLPNTGLPGGDIPVEYQNGNNREETRNGVRIIRASLHPRKTGAVNRIRNYLSFWSNANAIARRLPGGFDVVLGYQFSPIMQVDPGLVYAKKNKVPMLLYSFDLWPQSLLAGGFKKESLPYKWMKSVSKRIYSQADRIAVTSPLFDEYFEKELGLNLPKSIYLPQYAEDLFGRESIEVPEGYDPSKINLTFAGNIGAAQSVETIVQAAAILSEDDRFIFHIVGSGSSLDKCKKLAEDLKASNVVFHGRMPLEDMPKYYSASDALLATFADDPVLGYTLPRKVQTYMAAGRPVLGTVIGEARRVIEAANCGFCCNAEDAEGLASIVLEFANCDDTSVLGENAKTYYLDNFSKELFFNVLESALKELKGTKHGN